MVWKPKEKELTFEEAVAAAKKELEPYWYRSEPLVCGVATPAGSQLVALKPSFQKQAWAVFFVDPTLVSSSTVYEVLGEWYSRYNQQQIGFLLILKQPFSFFSERPLINSILEAEEIHCSVVVDSEGLLAAAFQISEFPASLILEPGLKVLFRSQGVGFSVGHEESLQEYLWRVDPGLPLSPPLEMISNAARDIAKVDFGWQPGQGVLPATFPLSGFVATDLPTRRQGNFNGIRTQQMPAQEVHLEGTWFQESDHIWTNDPKAELGVSMPGPNLSLVAKSLGKSDDLNSSKIQVWVGDKSAYESVAGKHLQLEENGMSLARIRGANVHQLLKNVPLKDREITLKTINADKDPVAFYGIRYGEMTQ